MHPLSTQCALLLVVVGFFFFEIIEVNAWVAGRSPWGGWRDAALSTHSELDYIGVESNSAVMDRVITNC